METMTGLLVSTSYCGFQPAQDELDYTILQAQKEHERALIQAVSDGREYVIRRIPDPVIISHPPGGVPWQATEVRVFSFLFLLHYEDAHVGESVSQIVFPQMTHDTVRLVKNKDLDSRTSRAHSQYLVFERIVHYATRQISVVGWRRTA